MNIKIVLSGVFHPSSPKLNTAVCLCTIVGNLYLHRSISTNVVFCLAVDNIYLFWTLEYQIRLLQTQM